MGAAAGSRMSWTPPPRPRFVERLIAHGEAVGGAARLVSLDGDELMDTARRATGLDDFGGDGWRPHFDVFLRALEDESRLHLLGRVLVRTEILLALRNRLELAALWKQHPEWLSEPVTAPTFIVGSPRSGTSILHELMACDPASRAPAMWEMQHPAVSVSGGDASDVADRVTQFWHDLQPEYETMHANSGHLPNECIFITLHEFLSDHWGGNHVVPSYDAHLRTVDHRPAYAYHKRFLQTLQTRPGPRRWLLKAPSHLFQLPALLAVYPDARIVRTHRDPLKTLPSAVSLLGTLKWMRCERVDMERVPLLMALGYAGLYRQEIDRRASGELPDDRFIDVTFDRLVADPAGAVGRVYEQLGWPFDDSVRARVAAYADAKPKDSRGPHRYSLEAVGLERSALREHFAFYMERFGIAEEDTSAGGREDR